VNGLVLASSSPRRRELLELLGVQFTVAPAHLDETPRAGEDPLGYVRRLAAEKAAAVGADDEVVLAADTTVVLDGTILGKPGSRQEAVSMLRALAGRSHLVHTGVAVRAGELGAWASATTSVTLVPLTDDDIEWYLGTDEPMDKAGAYALQGAGGLFVAAIDGSSSNVVGLPLHLLPALFAEVGHPLSSFR
jgi:septum formation protein